MKKVRLILSALIAVAFVLSMVPAAMAASSVSFSANVNNFTKNASGAWAKSITADPGDEAVFMVTIRNTSTAAINSLKLKASFPAGLSRVDNFTKIYKTGGNIGLANTIDTTGVDLPSLGAGSVFYVTIKAKLASSGLTLGSTISPSFLLTGAAGFQSSADSVAININSASVTTVTTPTTTTTTTTNTNTTPTTNTTTNQPAVNNNPANVNQAAILAATAWANNYTKNSSGGWTDPIIAGPGDEVMFMIDIHNNGNAAATGINLKANLPAGMSRVDGFTKLYTTASNVTGLANTIDTNGVSLPDLAVGSSYYVTSKVKLADAGIANGSSLDTSFTISATGVSASPDSARVNISFTTPTLNPIPVNVTMIGQVNNFTQNSSDSWAESASANPGDEMVYMIKVSNPAGNGTLTGVKVKAELPAGITRIDNFTKLFHKNAAGQDVVTGQENTIDTTGVTLLNLPAASSYFLTAKFKIATSANGALTANFKVTADQNVNLSDAITVNVSGTPNPQNAVVIETQVNNFTKNSTGGWAKSVTADPGDEIVYMVKVRNNTNATLTGIRLSVALPAGMTRIDNFTKLFHKNAAGADVVTGQENTIDTAGISLLDLPANSGYYVTYKVKIANDASLKGKTLKAMNKVSANGIAQLSDDSAVVVILGAVTPPAPNPGTLPQTGPELIITLLLTMLMFAAITGYIYMKERKALKFAMKSNQAEVSKPDNVSEIA